MVLKHYRSIDRCILMCMASLSHPPHAALMPFADASRDDPAAQAAQPTQGKSDEQIVQVCPPRLVVGLPSLNSMQRDGTAAQPAVPPACGCNPSIWKDPSRTPEISCPITLSYFTLDPMRVQEQGAGATVRPKSAGNAEGGAPLDQEAQQSPGFAGVTDCWACRVAVAV